MIEAATITCMVLLVVFAIAAEEWWRRRDRKRAVEIIGQGSLAVLGLIGAGALYLLVSWSYFRVIVFAVEWRWFAGGLLLAWLGLSCWRSRQDRHP